MLEEWHGSAHGKVEKRRARRRLDIHVGRAENSGWPVREESIQRRGMTQASLCECAATKLPPFPCGCTVFYTKEHGGYCDARAICVCKKLFFGFLPSANQLLGLQELVGDRRTDRLD